MRAEVENRLKSYRADVARVACLKLQIEHDARALKHAKENALAEDAAPVVHLDASPHAQGMHSSPVESLLERYESGYLPPIICNQKRELDAKKRALDALETQVAMIPLWLDALPQRERWVIERHLIDGLSWPEVIAETQSAFGFEMSDSGVRLIKRRALKRLESLLDTLTD